MRTIRYHNNYGTARIYLLGAIGTVVEWYDFAIYGHLSSIFARQFFADKSPWISLVLVYSIFFTSYLVRPLGALIYGYIGDNLGRRTALLFSIGMMTVSMLAMMLLPTSDVIGSMAPFLLLVFRIMQGLSAGGETSGALVYVLESVNRKHYGLYGSMTWGMLTLGILFGSGVVALLAGVLTDSQLVDWGWRLAYFIGILLGMIIFFLRSFMPESIEFAQMQEAGSQKEDNQIDKSLFNKVFLECKSTILMIIACAALPAASTYFTFFYFPQYTHHYWHIKLSSVMLSDTIFGVLLIGIRIFFGYLSDRVTKKRLMVLSGICFLLLSYPILSLVALSRFNALVIVPMILTFLVGMYEGPLPGVMVKLSPLRVRYTLVSLGYNISFAIFGGGAMLISSLLIHWLHDPLAPAFYLMVAAILSLTALFLLRHWKNV